VIEDPHEVLLAHMYLSELQSRVQARNQLNKAMGKNILLLESDPKDETAIDMDTLLDWNDF
jgi:hypothetical protein